MHFGRSPYDIAEGADALVIVTEWDAFRALDLDRLGNPMTARVFVDLRNIYKPEDVEKHGFTYTSIGRPKRLEPIDASTEIGGSKLKNLWNDAEAKSLIDTYAERGIETELALRVYTTRLLGGEPRLVLHGGGNTSVKLRMTDLVGDEWDVLCVKGSGWDMGVIEPQGLPAVKLAPLLKARKLTSLSDEDMVALQRANLIDPTSPNPSVETLLHAFLPHKFVDHTHSTAILALVDQQDSKPICEEVFGKTFGFVPYIKPGFDLAKAAAEVYEQDTSVIGLILDKHGIFTFGDTARKPTTG